MLRLLSAREFFTLGANAIKIFLINVIDYWRKQVCYAVENEKFIAYLRTETLGNSKRNKSDILPFRQSNKITSDRTESHSCSIVTVEWSSHINHQQQ